MPLENPVYAPSCSCPLPVLNANTLDTILFKKIQTIVKRILIGLKFDLMDTVQRILQRSRCRSHTTLTTKVNQYVVPTVGVSIITCHEHIFALLPIKPMISKFTKKCSYLFVKSTQRLLVPTYCPALSSVLTELLSTSSWSKQLMHYMSWFHIKLTRCFELLSDTCVTRVSVVLTKKYAR